MVVIETVWAGLQNALLMLWQMLGTIVTAALIIDGEFDAAGLIPQARLTCADVFGGVKIDYTFVLNALAGAGLAALLWLSARAPRARRPGAYEAHAYRPGLAHGHEPPEAQAG
jgi:hypothetical protein